MNKIIALSGAFDPPTVGQTQMISHASRFGDVIIILNSDRWLSERKFNIFLSREQRKQILFKMPGVVDIIDADDEDGTVCNNLRKLCPDMFGNGGYRTPENTPEIKLCRELGIELVWQIGSVEDTKNIEKLYKKVIRDGQKK
jgi:glycerol-3-phosphate cytidylyltransferase-like family protein